MPCYRALGMEGTTLQRRCALFLSWCFLAACSAPPGSSDSPDAGLPLAPCELTAAPEPVELSEGGRLHLTVSPTSAVADWNIADAGSLAGRKLDGGRLELKAPYGLQGSHSVSLSLDCGG